MKVQVELFLGKPDEFAGELVTSEADAAGQLTVQIRDLTGRVQHVELYPDGQWKRFRWLEAPDDTTHELAEKRAREQRAQFHAEQMGVFDPPHGSAEPPRPGQYM